MCGGRILNQEVFQNTGVKYCLTSFPYCILPAAVIKTFPPSFSTEMVFSSSVSVVYTLPCALGSVDMNLKGIDTPQKLNLEVCIEGSDAVNDWDFWVYPAQVGNFDVGMECFIIGIYKLRNTG